MAFRFHVPQYLTRRAADWKARGFAETLVDFAALNARSKFWGDDQRAAFRNWEEVSDPRNPHGRRQGVNERIMLRELLRRVDMMVMLENRLDALVRLHTPFPPGGIGGAYQPGLPHNLRLETFYGPNAGLTEVLIPAGYVTTVYDPVFALSADGTRYVPVPSEHADHHSGAGIALLAGVPGRAGPGGCPPARSPRPTKPPRSAASRRPRSAPSPAHREITQSSYPKLGIDVPPRGPRRRWVGLPPSAADRHGLRTRSPRPVTRWTTIRTTPITNRIQAICVAIAATPKAPRAPASSPTTKNTSA